MRMKKQRTAKSSACVNCASTSRRRLFPLINFLHAYLPHSHGCLISYSGKTCEGCKARQLGGLLLFLQEMISACPSKPFLGIFWIIEDVCRKVTCGDRDVVPKCVSQYLSLDMQRIRSVAVPRAGQTFPDKYRFWNERKIVSIDIKRRRAHK